MKTENSRRFTAFILAVIVTATALITYSINIIKVKAADAIVVSTDNTYYNQMSAANQAKVGSNIKNLTLSNGNPIFSYNDGSVGTNPTNVTSLYLSEANDAEGYWYAANEWSGNPYDGTGWSTWSARYGYVKNSIYWILNNGYPYNNGSINSESYLKRAVSFYGIDESLAQDALRLATQIAIWKISNENYSNINYGACSSYNASMGDPIFYLAGELAYYSYEASSSSPATVVDMYKNTTTVSDKTQYMVAARTSEMSSSNFTINGNVVLKNATLTNKQFKFVLYDSQFNTIETVSNDASGNFSFSPLLSHVTGEKTYYIKQIVGDDTSIKYDQTEYTVKVTTTGSKNLSSTITYNDSSSLTLSNKYMGEDHSQQVAATVKATKTLDGNAPGNKTFTFVLYDSSNDEVDRTTNDSEGNIVFKTLYFNNPGTYKYTIQEIDDGQSDISYDKSVYDVTITVSSVTTTELEDDQSYIASDTAIGNEEFYVGTSLGDIKYHVYCMNNKKYGPLGQTYTTNVDPTDEEIRLASTKPDEVSVDELKRTLYFFEKYPNRFPTQYERQLILWQVTGQNHNKDNEIEEILNTVTEVPSNMHVVMFNPPKESLQDMIYIYFSPEPTITYNINNVEGKPVFKNTTVIIPQVPRLGDYGGIGTTRYRYFGIVLITLYLIYRLIKNKNTIYVGRIKR